MSASIIAWIRTIVPVAIGSLLGWLVTLGIEVDDTTRNALEVGVIGLAIAAYYTLARLLESKIPWLGVLLGVPKTPDSYTRDTPNPETWDGISGTNEPLDSELSLPDETINAPEEPVAATSWPRHLA